MQAPDRLGEVILLNGASSSGTTSRAQALPDVLPTPWFHVGVDLIGSARAVHRTGELGEAALAQVLGVAPGRRTRLIADRLLSR